MLANIFSMRTAIKTELLWRKWNQAQLRKKLIKNEGDEKPRRCNVPEKHCDPRTKGIF